MKKTRWAESHIVAFCQCTKNLWLKMYITRRAALFLTLLLGVCLNLMAQEADSISMPPSFGVDYTGEVQTDFERVRVANLLQLHADVPLSKKLTFQVGSLSTLSTNQDLEVYDVQGFSNIDTYDLNVPFALTVAGIAWQINDRHSLFAGIRRVDEDYFCSDGLTLYTCCSPGIFPTLSYNANIATFPVAAMGIHYAYDHQNLCLQASVYNGEGNYRFEGRNNVFRICPNDDGIFAIGQVEYRHRDNHYYLGGTVHTVSDIQPSAWVYTEQTLMSNLTLVAVYSHAFGGDNFCNDFFGLGGKYSFKRAQLGLFTDYTRVLGVDEWATELICSLHLTDFLKVKPVLHVITTDSTTKCVGLLRVDIGI